MIDIRRLKELVKLMVENDLAELDLRDQQETVSIRRNAAGDPVVAAPALPNGNNAADTTARPRETDAADSNGEPAGDGTPANSDSDEGLQAVSCPMVGTFYAAPNPDAEPFVSVGSPVGEGTVVCVVEAMKVFNEIKAEVEGTVERILVKNGESVEYGQRLFLVRPS